MSGFNFFTDLDEQFGAQFKMAEVKEQFGNLPDGNHKVVVEKVFANKNKFDSTPQISWEFRIPEGEYANQKIFKHNKLDTQEKMNWLKTDLVRAGEDVISVSDIPNALEKITGRTLIVTLKSNKASNGKVYQNVYISKVVDEIDTFNDFPF